MVDPTLPLPGLSPVAGEEIVARFDGGRLSSDGADSDAEALLHAGRSVRHAQTAPDQDRRSHRRDENQDQDPSADQHSRSDDLASGTRPAATPDDLTRGAVCPSRALPRNLQPLPDPTPRARGSRPTRPKRLTTTKPRIPRFTQTRCSLLVN